MTARFAHTLPWGAELVDGGARFKPWAPAQDKITLLAERAAGIGAAVVPFFTYPDDAGASLAQATLPPWSVVASLTSQE